MLKLDDCPIKLGLLNPVSFSRTKPFGESISVTFRVNMIMVVVRKGVMFR